MTSRPAPLVSVLLVTFLGSVSGGAFWSATFFITENHYRFSAEKNLALGAAMGAVYAVVARAAGPSLRRFSSLTPRSVLVGALSVWGAASLALLAVPSFEPVLWAVALVGSVASGIVWPIVESYLGAGRHGAELRRAVGTFNVTWTLATALPLLFMHWLAKIHVLWTLSISAIVNVLAIPFLFTLARAPGNLDHGEPSESIGREYDWLWGSASLLLPLSYVMSSTLSPLLPYRLSGTELPVPMGVLGATWMLTRFLTLGFMSFVPFWHGKWSTLVLAGGALAGGLGLVFLADTAAGIAAGLALFGIGMGLTYSLALYYALAVGKGAVDAGGGFEALIGLGYLVGPLLGLAGRGLGGARSAATTTVLLTWVVAALTAAAALRPYLEARRRR